MSFFDEADEPQPRQETRRTRVARPPRSRSGRPPGGSGRPPGSQHQQEVQTRRLIAAGVVVVIVIAMALLIKSCDSSAATSALKNYSSSVSVLNKGSVGNAQNVLSRLTEGNLASTATSTYLADAEDQSQRDVTSAEKLQAPSQLAAAQASLVTLMQQREQALELIAQWAPQTTNKKDSQDAVYKISLGTAQLFASDVLYKTVVTVDIAEALNAASIPIGTGQQDIINGDQVIPDLGWLSQTWIADKVGAQQSTAAANANNDQPGLHGHSLNSVTVGGIALVPGVTNKLVAKNSRDWTLSVTNGGDYNEYQVGCSVKIVGFSDVGTGSIAETIAHGGTSSCDVKLPSTPAVGAYQVIANVAKVPGEANLSNNTITYNVDFS